MTHASAETFLAERVSATEGSALGELYARCADYYQRRLYHELTETVMELLRQEHFDDPLAVADELQRLYNDFVRAIESRIAELRLVQICSRVAASYTDFAACYEFIERVYNKVAVDAGAQTYAEAVMAELRVFMNEPKAALKHLEQCEARLANAPSEERSVNARYYRAAVNYHKAQMSALDFYRNGLLYLAYEELDTVPLADQIALAFDMSIAALIGDVYNFGELLSHPIIRTLDGTPSEWVARMLRVVNAGDIDGYAALRKTHADRFKEQPALHSSARLLREKITILAIIALVFERPTNERRVAFADIAKVGRLKPDEVELVVMRALSLGLVKGTIDEVDKVVSFTWVQPRVLDLKQVATMKQRLDEWQAQVKQTLGFLESHTANMPQ